MQELSESENGTVSSAFIEDQSTHGTWVNGHKLVRGKRKRLEDGDTIRLIYTHPTSEQCEVACVALFELIHIPHAQFGRFSFDQEFVVGKELGKGNFATVFLARHTKTSSSCAVKVLTKKLFSGKPKLIQNIEQEISILRLLEHPCIIKIHQVYDLPKSINIVMEFAKGGELFDRIISCGHFSERDTRIVMTQLFSALEYLHARNIVHRDLKPENILLASEAADDWRIKISDFGLAKLVPEKDYLKTLCGTPNYVAPEVLNKQGDRAYGSPVDLWSCGVILYICLVGQPPFSDELAPPKMLDQIKQGKFSFPSPWWDNVSPSAIALIKKLILLNPEARLTSTQALNHPFMVGSEGDKDASPISTDPAIAQLPIPKDAKTLNEEKTSVVLDPKRFLDTTTAVTPTKPRATAPAVAPRIPTAKLPKTPPMRGRRLFAAAGTKTPPMGNRAGTSNVMKSEAIVGVVGMPVVGKRKAERVLGKEGGSEDADIGSVKQKLGSS
ncbi:hypothetical protein HDU98_012054 [Podochytrium sp. JEL0797]|nr:hypothetical protein HDU98_012054 [Podochytrium sp. JEL0797]